MGRLNFLRIEISEISEKRNIKHIFNFKFFSTINFNKI